MATAAAASPSPVTGTTCNLSVLGADDAGESNLTYTWATAGTPPAAVSFGANGSNAAKNTTATFSRAGIYSFQVTIADAGGLTATSSVNVTVNQTFAGIVVAPASINLEAGGSQQFSATAMDQFGAALAAQPGFHVGGERGDDQRHRAADRSGQVGRHRDGDRRQRRRQRLGGVHGHQSAADREGGGQRLAEPGDGDDLQSCGAGSGRCRRVEPDLHLGGHRHAAGGRQVQRQRQQRARRTPRLPSSKAGNYSFQVTITDAGGLTTTSSVNVTVNQTLTSIAVAPASVTLHAGAGQQFTATAQDQFGAALTTQPTFIWTATAGTINTSGLLTAPNTPVASGTRDGQQRRPQRRGGVHGQSAADGGHGGRATPNPVTGTTCNLSVLGADDGRRVEPDLHVGRHRHAARGSHLQRQRQQYGEEHHGCLQQGGQLHLPSHDHGRGRLDGHEQCQRDGEPNSQRRSRSSPPSIDLHAAGVQQFTATAEDQFGAALATQPSFTWTATAGTISATGLLTAPDTSVNSATVTAGSNGINGTASFTVTDQPPTVAAAAAPRRTP